MLNFPKTDETHTGEKGEKRGTKSASDFERCGCRPPSFVAPPDLTQVRIYLIVFGRTQTTATLPKPTRDLGLEPAPLVSSSSVTACRGARVTVG